MILISNLTLSVEDGGTIASTEIYGADKKTYINIGSGNVFRLSWETPILANDTVDYYKLVIKRHDTTLNVYYDIFDKNIGLVNEFYVDSSLLPAIPLQYKLSIYVIAYGKQGSTLTSNVATPFISKGSGNYKKTEGTNKVPSIWKRALAFTKEPTQGEAPVVILSKEGNTVQLLDNNEVPVQTKATRVLTSTSWSVVQDCYVKNSSGNWQSSDIDYEVLLALKEGTTDEYEIATDSSGEPIYVL